MGDFDIDVDKSMSMSKSIAIETEPLSHADGSADLESREHFLVQGVQLRRHEPRALAHTLNTQGPGPKPQLLVMGYLHGGK